MRVAELLLLDSFERVAGDRLLLKGAVSRPLNRDENAADHKRRERQDTGADDHAPRKCCGAPLLGTFENVRGDTNRHHDCLNDERSTVATSVIMYIQHYSRA